jgi:energy-converting hydrogenase Eha subunit H
VLGIFWGDFVGKYWSTFNLLDLALIIILLGLVMENTAERKMNSRGEKFVKKAGGRYDNALWKSYFLSF